jgi:diguanylate cyclase (GGDEF)-like protein
MDELQYRSSHDMLTGLINRHQYEAEVDRLDSSASIVSILMADLDGLKSLNDSFGHAAGDRMLCDTANLLRHSVTVPSIVARVGGDEFVVLLESCDEEGAKRALIEIQSSIDRFNAECTDEKAENVQRPCPLSLSIGISTRKNQEPLRTTLKRADDAMYVEKNTKRLMGDAR